MFSHLPSAYNAETPSGLIARAAAGVIVALLAGVAMLAWATNGFAVLTTDAARARNVAQAPVAVPLVNVWNADGTQTPLLYDASNAGSQPPRAVIVDFIYTRCITLCSTLGGVFQQLQRELIAQGLESRVRLLSVSFDVEHDSPERLARQAKLMGAQPTLWSFVTPTSKAERDSLLEAFGVQVVPEKDGQWQHNAALHIVSGDGRLVRIVDISDAAGALAVAKGLAP